MRVWLFQIGEPLPWQVNRRVMRSGRIAKEMVRRGHEVVWWTSRFDHYAKSWLELANGYTDPDGIHYQFLDGIGYRHNYGIRRFIDHWLMAQRFERRAPAEVPPDLILANLPDHRLAAAAIKFGHAIKVPTVLDLRDMWPDLIVDRVSGPFRFLARCALHFDYRLAGYAIRSAGVLFTMMQGYLEAAYFEKGRVPVPADCVLPIGAENAAGEQAMDRDLFALIKQKAGTRKVVSFIGSLNDTYAPYSMVGVARAQADESKAMGCFFVVGGDGPHLAALRERARNMEDTILFTGWLNEAGIAAVLQASSVGYIISERPVNAFPNKFFTYASAGVPLICNLLGDMKTLLQEHEIGIFLESRSSEAIRRALRKLTENETLLASCRSNLKNLFEQNYNVTAITATYANNLEAIHSANPTHG